jgi:hypothetical protein
VADDVMDLFHETLPLAPISKVTVPREELLHDADLPTRAMLCITSADEDGKNVGGV